MRFKFLFFWSGIHLSFMSMVFCNPEVAPEMLDGQMMVSGSLPVYALGILGILLVV